ncbi:hypothetical protein CXB51_020623 [Gossypium anomalum]|uniref:LRAT domain-containing protein n=4 Tax=Gossypium TaxID=3633 RepID=A0A8J5YDA7_9ROSI|nr:protein LEAD-SENSITIVE 1-like isoform X1 [Gossypium arboreum]KAG8487083.1 hypothetical protein CXB51_020623 [Gossypium anomalum]TYI16400.1 hypothetical protein ES332_A08G252100v1 [Gossypium tomentosum]TYJ24093.1 hypothetical protein E1A91_A08G237500v1 [Gossypium mustelinum]
MGQPQSKPSKPRFPQPGDHIYCERKGGLYDHHGIYVGDGMVIHLRGAAKKLGELPACHRCGGKRVENGEIAKVCIDCFLDGETLQIYDYGVPVLEFISRKRGTCCTSRSKPPHEVISAATDLLERNGFGPYDMFTNNCEHFAVYCKTGSKVSYQILGRIELATTAGPAGILAGAAVAAGYGASGGM